MYLSVYLFSEKNSLILMSFVTEDKLKFVGKILFRSHRRNKTLTLTRGQIDFVTTNPAKQIEKKSIT